MKRHIAIKEEVYKKIKETAAERGQFIGIFVERAMADWFAAQQTPRTLVDSRQPYETEK